MKKIEIALFVGMMFAVCLGGIRLQHDALMSEQKAITSDRKNSYLETENRILMNQISLLKDHVTDLNSQGTYSEGLADGLVRAANIGYQDGYHSAVAQFAETTPVVKGE